jgi:hypothetical protein
MATKKAASKSKTNTPAKSTAVKAVEGKNQPKIELFYRVLTSFLFGHQVFAMGSVEHFSEAEAELLLARGVIKEVQESK